MLVAFGLGGWFGYYITPLAELAYEEGYRDGVIEKMERMERKRLKPKPYQSMSDEWEGEPCGNAEGVEYGDGLATSTCKNGYWTKPVREKETSNVLRGGIMNNPWYKETLTTRVCKKGEKVTLYIESGQSCIPQWEKVEPKPYCFTEEEMQKWVDIQKKTLEMINYLRNR